MSIARKDPEATKAYNKAYYQANKGKRKTHTSSEVKARYNAKTYKQYSLNLRKVEDAATIAKIEAEKAKGYTTSQAIKRLIDK